MITRNSLKALFKTTQDSSGIKPWIIIDTSYLVYYSAFSAWKWLKEEYGLENNSEYNPIDNKDYKSLLEKRFIDFIYYPITNGLNHIFSPNKVIFALDAPKIDLWRNSIFPEYKIKRKLKDKSDYQFDYNPVFKYVEDIIIPTFCEKHIGAKFIKIPTAEGDDIIATIVSKILKSEEHKVIIASDHDFCQLLSIPNLEIINCQNQKLTLENESQKKILQEANHVLTAKEVLLYKILRGDIADSIKPIFKGCGETKTCKFILNKDELKQKLKEPEIQYQYKLNRSLIDLSLIPQEVTNAIMEAWNG